MESSARRPIVPQAAARFLGSAPFASALTTLIFLTAFGTHLIRSLIEWPGLIAIVLGLVALSATSFWFRREHVEWQGAVPISVIVFIVWATISIFWADATLASGLRIGYLLTFAFLGFYIALLRDTIQIVRAAGDALRVLLVLSLALEIFSGILIDTPIRFLGITGQIADLGPIQGVFGTRNLLGFISLIAAITFGIELATRSVPRLLGQASVLLAVICILLSRSPVIVGVLTVVVVAALALFAVRRLKPEHRWRGQVALLVAVTVTGVVLWAARSRVVELLNAGSEFETRLGLWREMSRYMQASPLQGWGWVGAWPRTPPYLWLNLATHRINGTGLNAYVDVYFQLGLIGFFAFVALVGLAIVRSWLLASDKRSIVYVWPALVMVALATVSLAESTTLFEAGWLLLVVCAVKSSRSMSWRDALRRHEPGPVPQE